ncbi:MAG: translation initiation factor IF-2, partial [Lentisphaeria bacterium]|nr:translation initiation factor IF-2 [Lentisphaeria bacterium]
GKGGKFPPRDNNNGGNAEAPAAGGEIHIKPPVVVKALADAMGKRPNEVISSLMMMNVLASINQTIDTEVAQKVAEKMGFTLVVDSKRDKDEHQKKEETEEVDPEDMEYDDSPKDLKPRPPIVTFMGHVDHGKTSLQDAIRKTHVAAGEAGGITQHIGASSVVLDGRAITFVDTPGHEAFTQMRARGANVTDIVVLVVAADDGFMPQTIEAMNHALAAKVPIVVAMNKCDLPDADTQKILLHMQQNNLMSEDWGGTVAAIPVSAKTGAGIDDLLERILLEAEMLELQANAKRPGLAYVLESQLEQGLGATASVVVKNGSLRVGDPIICGEYYGKIKTLIDFRGKRVAVAPPSTPVKVVGLSGVPEAGTKMAVCKNINEAKQLAEARGDSNRIEALSSKTAGTSLEDLFSQMDDSKKNSLKVIVKSDVRGSSEAIVESLRKLPSEKISVDVLHTGVGAITENDVLLAASSDAIVVGFHVRVNPGVNDLAKKSNVEIRLYSIIYELIEDITDALAGRLEPEKREKDIGTVKILKIFQLSKGPKICGCMVEKGVARTGAKARVFRNNELIFNGEVRSLRRYQDDVKEVHQGLECGIRLDNFIDFTEGDIIQLYEIELKKATLT